MIRAYVLALGSAVLVALEGCQDEGPSGLEGVGEPAVLESSTKKLDIGVCSPGQGGFTLGSNPYFPLDVGMQWDLQGEEDDESVRVLVTVLNLTRTIDGVTTRVVEEREWVDDELAEVAWNYFARASDGTMCYYGEDVDVFEDGEISHPGAWCADEAGNEPGIIMPADPKPGMTYPTEVAPGIAEDEAKIVGSGPVSTPFGRFTQTIRIREFNPLDEEKGYKVFAEGVGLVIDEVLLLEDLNQNAPAPPGPIPTDQTCGV